MTLSLSPGPSSRVVANGAACGCVCFGYGRRLIARNAGNVRAHPFAYRSEDMLIDCLSAGETAKISQWWVRLSKS